MMSEVKFPHDTQRAMTAHVPQPSSQLLSLDRFKPISMLDLHSTANLNDVGGKQLTLQSR